MRMSITPPFRARAPWRARAALAGSLGAIALVAASCAAASAAGNGSHHDPSVGTARDSSRHAGVDVSARLFPRPEWPGSPAGTTATSTTSELPAPAPGLVAGRVTVVGDSVTVDAGPALQALVPGCQLDAEVGEQWETGIAAVEQLRSSGQLGSIVVVALGTNGPVSAGEFAQMMSALRGVSRVVFVTDHAPDNWEEQNNAMFKAEVPHYPTARIADWDAAAKANPSWLYSDGTHMPIGGAGAYAWARLVKAQI